MEKVVNKAESLTASEEKENSDSGQQEVGRQEPTVPEAPLSPAKNDNTENTTLPDAETGDSATTPQRPHLEEVAAKVTGLAHGTVGLNPSTLEEMVAKVTEQAKGMASATEGVETPTVLAPEIVATEGVKPPVAEKVGDKESRLAPALAAALALAASTLDGPATADSLAKIIGNPTGEGQPAPDEGEGQPTPDEKEIPTPADPTGDLVEVDGNRIVDDHIRDPEESRTNDAIEAMSHKPSSVLTHPQFVDVGSGELWIARGRLIVQAIKRKFERGEIKEFKVKGYIQRGSKAMALAGFLSTNEHEVITLMPSSDEKRRCVIKLAALGFSAQAIANVKPAALKRSTVSLWISQAKERGEFPTLETPAVTLCADGQERPSENVGGRPKGKKPNTPDDAPKPVGDPIIYWAPLGTVLPRVDGNVKVTEQLMVDNSGHQFRQASWDIPVASPSGKRYETDTSEKRTIANEPYSFTHMPEKAIIRVTAQVKTPKAKANPEPAAEKIGGAP